MTENYNLRKDLEKRLKEKREGIIIDNTYANKSY